MTISYKKIILNECLDYLKSPAVNEDDVKWCDLKQYLINVLNMHVNISDYITYLPTELRKHVIKEFNLTSNWENIELLKTHEDAFIKYRLKNKVTIDYIDELLVARLLFK